MEFNFLWIVIRMLLLSYQRCLFCLGLVCSLNSVHYLFGYKWFFLILLLIVEEWPLQIVYNLQIEYMGYQLETVPSGVYCILGLQCWRVHQWNLLSGQASSVPHSLFEKKKLIQSDHSINVHMTHTAVQTLEYKTASICSLYTNFFLLEDNFSKQQDEE